MSHTCCHCHCQFWPASSDSPFEPCECGRCETIKAFRERKWADREPDNDALEQRRAERRVDARAQPDRDEAAALYRRHEAPQVATDVEDYT